jgi:hypothetical protein
LRTESVEKWSPDFKSSNIHSHFKYYKFIFLFFFFVALVYGEKEGFESFDDQNLFLLQIIARSFAPTRPSSLPSSPSRRSPASLPTNSRADSSRFQTFPDFCRRSRRCTRTRACAPPHISSSLSRPIQLTRFENKLSVSSKVVTDLLPRRDGVITDTDPVNPDLTCRVSRS